MVYNFSWIIPDRVGGMARPRPEDRAWLVAQGVTALVSVTPHAPEGFGDFEICHMPVEDMTSPTLEQLHQCVQFMRAVVEGEGKVVVHCGAGLGRTGTTLAAYLIGRGAAAAEAIAMVRALRPGSIETAGQETTIHEYAELVGAQSR